MDLKKVIRTIPDWPKEGIMFRDITPVLKDAKAFQYVIDNFAERYKDKKVDLVVGIESRGFILGGAVAEKLGVGFIPIRKTGKLPAETDSIEYELEYGMDKLEMHLDAIEKGNRVLLLDDLIATGGTALAAAELVKRRGAEIVEMAFVIALPDVGGLKKLNGYNVHYMVEFEGD